MTTGSPKGGRASSTARIGAFLAVLAALVVGVLFLVRWSGSASTDGAAAPSDESTLATSSASELAHPVVAPSSTSPAVDAPAPAREVLESPAPTTATRPPPARSYFQRRFSAEITVTGDAVALSALSTATLVIEPEVVSGSKSQRGADPCIHEKRTEPLNGRRQLRFDNLCLGLWHVWIGGAGITSGGAHVNGEEDGAVLTATITLRGSRTFTVAIQDDAGRPLPLSTRLDARVRMALDQRILPQVCSEAPHGDTARLSSCIQARARAVRSKDESECAFEIVTDVLGPLWVGAAFGDAVLAWTPVAADAHDVVLAIDEARLRAAFRSVDVLVRDRGHGAPIEGATVTASVSGGADASATTGADGRARIELVAAGQGKLRAEKQGYAASSVPLDTREAAPPALELALAAEVTLRGTLVDENGQPVVGYVVAIEDFDGAPDRAEGKTAHVMAAADGSFAIEGLIPARYYVTDSRGSEAVRSYLQSRRPGTAELEPQALKVDLRHGSVAGAVVRATKRTQ